MPRRSIDLDHKRLEALAHQRLSRFCMEHGNYKEAYNHLALKQSLDDSIFNIESEQNINRLKADFDIYQIETSNSFWNGTWPSTRTRYSDGT